MTVLACSAITATAHDISCGRPATHQVVVEFAPGLAGTFLVCTGHATGRLPALWTRVVSAHVIGIELRHGAQPGHYDVVQSLGDAEDIPPTLGSVVRTARVYHAQLARSCGAGSAVHVQTVRIGRFSELSNAAQAVVDQYPTIRAALETAELEMEMAG